jgi:hypothetical protein
MTAAASGVPGVQAHSAAGTGELGRSATQVGRIDRMRFWTDRLRCRRTDAQISAPQTPVNRRLAASLFPSLSSLRRGWQRPRAGSADRAAPAPLWDELERAI